MEGFDRKSALIRARVPGVLQTRDFIGLCHIVGILNEAVLNLNQDILLIKEKLSLDEGYANIPLPRPEEPEPEEPAPKVEPSKPEPLPEETTPLLAEGKKTDLAVGLAPSPEAETPAPETGVDRRRKAAALGVEVARAIAAAAPAASSRPDNLELPADAADLGDDLLSQAESHLLRRLDSIRVGQMSLISRMRDLRKK